MSIHIIQHHLYELYAITPSCNIDSVCNCLSLLLRIPVREELVMVVRSATEEKPVASSETVPSTAVVSVFVSLSVVHLGEWREWMQRRCTCVSVGEDVGRCTCGCADVGVGADVVWV